MKYRILFLLTLTLLLTAGCQKSICGNGIVEKGETMLTCCEDTGCLGEQTCQNHQCIEPVCGECQYLENHICIDYECCKNDDCSDDEKCVNHKCVRLDCGSCQYVKNHRCKDYVCCNDNDCDDQDIATTDFCIFPQTINSQCNHKRCDAKITKFIASNNPEHYLGNIVGDEILSDWKNYQPLISKVNELIAGLTTDKEKAEAIGLWVKHSRPYQYEGVSIANQLGSIIEIFNSQEGVCIDANYLSVAMMRIAGIPSRAVSPWTGTGHQQTQVYIDDEWLLMDTTFSNSNSLWRSGNNTMMFVHEYAGYSSETDFYYTIIHPIPKDEYGILEYPELTHVNCPEFIPQMYYKSNNIWIRIYGPAGYSVTSREFYPNYRDINILHKDEGDMVHVSLPVGNYKIIYVSTADGSEVATVETNVIWNKVHRIYPSDLKKMPKVSDEQFEVFQTFIDIC